MIESPSLCPRDFWKDKALSELMRRDWRAMNQISRASQLQRENPSP